MNQADTAAEPRQTGIAAIVRDLVALTKPRVSALVVFTFAGGLWIAPNKVAPGLALSVLIGTVLIVAAANAFNMYLERDSDGLMRRTAARPLPQGRLSPAWALAFGSLLACLAVPPLVESGKLLAAAMGMLAFYAYVGVYTPMKRRSWFALYVGAVPGAMPPLMGYVTATERLDLAGLALFSILFCWQIPHFVAIAQFRGPEYAAAGIKVLPMETSPRQSQTHALIFSLALVASTTLLAWVGAAGQLFLWGSLALGLAFTIQVARGFVTPQETQPLTVWARRTFFVSLIYLTALFILAAVDRLIG